VFTQWIRRGTSNIFDEYGKRDPKLPESVVKQYNVPAEIRAE